MIVPQMLDFFLHVITVMALAVVHILVHIHMHVRKISEEHMVM